MIRPNQDRISSIDALRGFALFGILVVNIFVFHAPYPHYGEYYFQFEGVEIIALTNMFFFFAGKFMFIFAFLFGYGCWMQYEKYKDHFAFKKFWLRRMSWLALFGIVHVLLLSWGDILLPYALLGMTLPFILRLNNGKLILLFLLIYMIPVYEFVLRHLLDFPSVAMQSSYTLAEDIAINSTGDYWEIFKLRMHHYFSFRNEKLVMYIPKEWSLFVIGIMASREKWANVKGGMKITIFILLATAIVVFWYFFRPTVFALFQLEGSFIQPLTLGLIVLIVEFVHGMLYIIGFWQLWQFEIFQNFFSSLKYTGRMSLTIYLMQSLICSILFWGLGFGLYGTQAPIQLLFLALLVFVCQSMFAVIWFEKFKFGPLEWLWRKLAYK